MNHDQLQQHAGRTVLIRAVVRHVREGDALLEPVDEHGDPASPTNAMMPWYLGVPADCIEPDPNSQPVPVRKLYSGGQCVNPKEFARANRTPNLFEGDDDE